MPAQLRRPTMAYAASRAFDAVGILSRPLAGAGDGTPKVVECPAGQVVRGGNLCFATISGRAAPLVNAFGFICDEP